LTHLSWECCRKDSLPLGHPREVHQTAQTVSWTSIPWQHQFQVALSYCFAWSSPGSYGLSRSRVHCTDLDHHHIDLRVPPRNRLGSSMAICGSACCPEATGYMGPPSSCSPNTNEHKSSFQFQLFNNTICILIISIHMYNFLFLLQGWDKVEDGKKNQLCDF